MEWRASAVRTARSFSRHAAEVNKVDVVAELSRART
jgi:hypothetical protein